MNGPRKVDEGLAEADVLELGVHGEVGRVVEEQLLLLGLVRRPKVWVVDEEVRQHRHRELVRPRHGDDGSAALHTRKAGPGRKG